MQKLKVILSAVFLVGGLLTTTQAESFILSGSLTGGSALDNGGSFQKLVGFTGSVGNNTFQDNNLYGFDEDQNIVIPSSLDADVGTSPLSVGTEVASHYIFFDPGPTRRAIGHVLFDSNVLAIMTTTDNLADSDFLINNSVTYLNPGLRGLEGGDTATIDGTNPKRVNIDFTASTPGDYVRVLTEHSPLAAAVPEPTSMFLLGGGLLGAFVNRKRRA